MQQVQRHFPIERVVFITALVLLIGGSQIPPAHYPSPENGLGYALGIVGGSMILLVGLYPLRKRIPMLSFLGGVPQWFRLHMVLGIAGPTCILLHCGFSLGAANSNVALTCMLLVSGSGIIGRYFYSRIHDGLDGRRATLGELQHTADALKARYTHVPMLPELLSRLEFEEQSIMEVHGMPGAAVLAPFVTASRAATAKRRIRNYVRTKIREAAQKSRTVAAHRKRLEHNVLSYVEARIQTTRKVAEFGVYERLFSFWHLLHMPLFFMLIAAGTVHVVSVHIY